MANEYLGKILKKLRNEKGYTQQQVADLLGLKNKSTLGSWEVGKSEPDGVTFLKLMRLYEVADIYATFNEEAPKSENVNLTDLEKHVMVAYRKSDDVTKEMVHRILNIKTNSNFNFTKYAANSCDIVEEIPETSNEFEKLNSPVGELKPDKDA